jgi:hypothetical protein
MAISLSPEHLVAKYIKSATNGRNISVRLRRIITLILIPIWIISLVWSISMLYQGVTAIRIAEKFDKAIKSEGYHHEYRNGNSQIVPNSVYHDLWQEKLWEAQNNIDLTYYSLLPILFVFIVPWIILRLVFWVIDAKETEQTLKIK